MSDTGSLHCIGNGTTAAYLDRANIVQLFGSPYTSPSVLDASFDASQPFPSSFDADAPIWTTALYSGSEKAGTVCDYALPESACLVREIVCASPLTLNIRLGRELSAGMAPVIDSTSLCPPARQAYTIMTRAGNYAYGHLALGFEQFYNLIFLGGASARLDASTNEITVRFETGESLMLIVSGSDYPELEANTEFVLALSPARLRSLTRQYYKACLGRSVTGQLSGDAPRYSDALRALTGTIFNLKSQQSRSGGILAGHFYHLGYVRDQYGDARGLMALGLYDEVRALLGFYLDTFSRYGFIRNAQGCGAPGIFHYAENDEVEITAYLIILAFQYTIRTGDDSLLTDLQPMLAWAYECLKRNFKGGMLPFNGDETYIAGGMLPRTCIDDGSAEGTLLFISACEAITSLYGRRGGFTPEKLSEISAAAREARDKFASNFLRGGKLITNNPSYRTLSQRRFCYGVCQGGLDGCYGFSWMRKDKNGFYLCPSCYAKGLNKAHGSEIYCLDTVSLMAEYMGSDVLDERTQREVIANTAAEKKFDGIVGYDYGLTLYDLCAIGHPDAHRFYDLTLDVLDECGAWVEYYRNGVGYNCRYRPWESAVNIDGVIKYLKTFGYMK